MAQSQYFRNPYDAQGFSYPGENPYEVNQWLEMQMGRPNDIQNPPKEDFESIAGEKRPGYNAEYEDGSKETGQFQGYQYPEMMRDLKNLSPKEYLNEYLKSKANINPYDTSNRKIMNTLLGGLATSANQIGNLRGQVAQTNLPQFAEEMNKGIDERNALIQSQADMANKRALQNLGLAKESFEYSYDEPQLNAIVKELSKTYKFIPEGTKYSTLNKLSPTLTKELFEIEKAKLKANKPEEMTPYQQAQIKQGQQRLGLQARGLQQQKEQKELERSRLSDTQIKNLTDKQDALAQVETAISQFETEKPYTGPGSSMIPDFARSAEGAAAVSAIRQMKDSYRRMITGAAAGPKELAALEKSIPTENDTPQNFKAKAALFRDNMANFYNRYWENIGKQGKNVEAFKLGENTPSTSKQLHGSELP